MLSKIRKYQIKAAKLVLALFIGLFMTSCDPTYSISVTNSTTDTVSIVIKPTIHFRTEKDKISKTSDGLDIYKLNPNEKIYVGSAIAEIDNDMPFQEFKIYKGATITVSASNLKDIKNLFDKTVFGGLKTPYNLTIK
jgi:hypothetical protein